MCVLQRSEIVNGTLEVAEGVKPAEGEEDVKGVCTVFQVQHAVTCSWHLLQETSILSEGDAEFRPLWRVAAVWLCCRSP